MRQRWWRRRRRWLLGQSFGERAASGEGGALLAVGGAPALPDRDLVGLGLGLGLGLALALGLG